MTHALLDTVLRVLSADAHRGPAPLDEARKIHDVILELLFQSDCRILERVSTTAETQAVHLLGTRGAGEQPLWLVSSMNEGDTSAPAPRFDADTGRLVGAGVLSGRADLALKILAASQFPVERLKRPVCIAALQGYEGQGEAAVELVDTTEAGVGVALVGAPTGGLLWASHPGSMTLKLSVTRTARHRRMPPMSGFYRLQVQGSGAHHLMASEGVDAIARAEALLDALRRDQSVRLLAIEAGEGIDRVASQAQLLVATSQEIGDLPADVHAEPLGDGATIPFPIDDLYAGWRTALAEATVAIEQLAQDPAGAVSGQPPGAPHVGRLSTGIDRLHSLLQLRWVAGQEAREVAETFSRAATSALEAHEELQIQVELLDERPPHDGGERDATWTHRAGEVLTSLGRDGAPREGALSTDAGRLALHGLSALTFGPGDPRTLYGPQESVSLEELEETLEFYVAMIASWCT